MDSEANGMRLDLLDLRILKMVYKDMSQIYYLSDITMCMRTSRSMIRLRLKKLCKFGFLKEVKTYPTYYIPNPILHTKVEAMKIPVFNI